jgi:hypothetical protein
MSLCAVTLFAVTPQHTSAAGERLAWAVQPVRGKSGEGRSSPYIVMKISKVSLEFVNYSDTEFDAFAGTVLTRLTKNPAFPNLPVAIAELGKLVAGFHASLMASLQGGLQLTAAKNAARDALERALRQEAHYVESMAAGNLETLLVSGYFAVTPNRRNAGPLPKPLLALVDLGMGRLQVKMPRVPDAKAYQVQYSASGNGGWQDLGTFTRTRGIVLEHLAPGTVYNIRAKAFGGSTGSSEWSDTASKMAT